MRRLGICLVFLLAVAVNSVYAHGPGGEGHGPLTEITESEAGERAALLVATIIEKGKLDATWAAVTPARIIKQIFNGSPEWIVTFDNPKEKDPEKQKLYVFISIYGQYLGANHTGT